MIGPEFTRDTFGCVEWGNRGARDMWKRKLVECRRGLDGLLISHVSEFENGRVQFMY